MRVEHLIYGTLPDTPGSQHIIYNSEGITPALQNWLITFYDQFGDCRNENFSKSLSVNWYREQSGEERAVITKVSHHGKDFSGRWGALLRHSAILTLQQYQELDYRPDDVEKRLISSGTAEELANFSDLEIETTGVPNMIPHFPVEESGGTEDFSDHLNNLSALLRGRRLVLYAENNTDYSNRYLRTLLSLLPLSCRKLLNWSEFAFRPSNDVDLALVYSSRHEAPIGGGLALSPIGENHLNSLAFTDEFINDYIPQLTVSLAQRDWSRLRLLLASE